MTGGTGRGTGVKDPYPASFQNLCGRLLRSHMCSRKRKILVAYRSDRMKAWPINSRVNSPKSNDSEIIVPIEVESGT
jgi:hypothetical protein